MFYFNKAGPAYIGQTGLHLNPPALAFQLLLLQACATMSVSVSNPLVPRGNLGGVYLMFLALVSNEEVCFFLIITFGLDLSDHRAASSDHKIFYACMFLSPSKGSYIVKIHTAR